MENNTLRKLQEQVYGQFSINETTKENYLKFKEEIKKRSHEHPVYIAYYIFKHRIGIDPETNLVDSNVIEKYLDDVVIPACHKGLYHGRIYPYSGGAFVESAKLQFKQMVRKNYNTYADPELVKKYIEEKNNRWR